MENLQQLVLESIKTHPELRKEIVSLYSLCLSEIEEGGSEQHEIELCTNDIYELINELNNGN